MLASVSFAKLAYLKEVSIRVYCARKLVKFGLFVKSWWYVDQRVDYIFTLSYRRQEVTNITGKIKALPDKLVVMAKFCTISVD